MHTPSLSRRTVAEFLGTGALVAIVVGSGIAASRLSPGDAGLQLLEHSLAPALGLAVLILVFQPISDAHFKPVVTVASARSLEPSARGERATVIAAQVAGG